jgi:hypothetical protein
MAVGMDWRGIAMEFIFMPYSAFHSDFDVVVMRGELRCGA